MNIEGMIPSLFRYSFSD